MAPVSGYVFRYEGKRRPTWLAKYRLPDGRQVKKTIGPAWTARGRPPTGYHTKRTAQAWLDDVLMQARMRTLPGMVRIGVTFADACDEYLRYVALDLDRKPSTVCDYRSIIRAHLLPAFGELRIEDVTTDRIEAWKATLPIGNRSKAKVLTVLNGVLKRARKVHKLRYNPMTEVEKPRYRTSTSIEVFAVEEIWALVRAAESEQDAAIFLTAAFTGLRRGELIALRWRDIDFTAGRVRVCGSYAGAALTAPKSGHVRSVPMAPDVATALARLANRERWAGHDDLVFPAVSGVPRRVGSVPPLQGRAPTRSAPPTALPRPPPHLRHTHDRQGRHPARPGVDGPCRRHHDDALPPLRRAPRRGRARRRGIRTRGATKASA